LSLWFLKRHNYKRNSCISLLHGVLGSLGDLATDGFLALGLFDDTDSNGLSHVSDGEATERGVLGEDLDNEGLLGDELNHSGVTGLDHGGVVFGGLAGTLVNLSLDVVELAGNVSGMAIEDWRVSVSDLTGMVEDDNLGGEVLGILAGIVLGVRAHEASLDVLDGQVLDVETNVVSGGSRLDLLVMHLDGLNFGGGTDGSEDDEHTGLDETGLDTADWHSSDTANLVDVLEGETEGLVHGSLGGVDIIEGIKEDGSLVPSHVIGSVDHVITVPSGNGDELDLSGVVADLLEVGGQLALDLVVSVLLVEDGGVVHLVDGNDHLTDTHGLGKESVLTGLTLG